MNEINKDLINQAKKSRTDNERFARLDVRPPRSNDYLKALYDEIFRFSDRTDLSTRLKQFQTTGDNIVISKLFNTLKEFTFEEFVRFFNNRDNLDFIQFAVTNQGETPFDDDCVPFLRPVVYAVQPSSFRSVFDRAIRTQFAFDRTDVTDGATGTVSGTSFPVYGDLTGESPMVELAAIASITKMSRSIRHFITYVKKGADQSSRLSANYKFRCVDIRQPEAGDKNFGSSIGLNLDKPAISFFGSRDRVSIDIMMPTVPLNSVGGKMASAGLYSTKKMVDRLKEVDVVSSRVDLFHYKPASGNVFGNGMVMITPGFSEWTWESFRQAFRTDEWISSLGDNNVYSRELWTQLFTSSSNSRDRSSRIRPDALSILTGRSGAYFDLAMGACTGLIPGFGQGSSAVSRSVSVLSHPVINHNDEIHTDASATELTFISPVDLLLLVESDWFQRNYVKKRGQQGLTLTHSELITAIQEAYLELASYHGWLFDAYYNNLDGDFSDQEENGSSFIVDDLHDKYTLRTVR